MAVVNPSPQRLPYYQRRRRRLRRDKIPFVNNTFIAPSMESIPGAHRDRQPKSASNETFQFRITFTNVLWTLTYFDFKRYLRRWLLDVWLMLSFSFSFSWADGSKEWWFLRPTQWRQRRWDPGCVFIFALNFVPDLVRFIPLRVRAVPLPWSADEDRAIIWSYDVINLNLTVFNSLFECFPFPTRNGGQNADYVYV